MFDSLAKMFSGGMDGISNLFSSGNSTWATNPALQGIADTANPAGMGQATFDFSKGLAGSSGMLDGLFKNMSLKDWGELGIGALTAKEMMKSNDLNNTLTKQNIDENNRIKEGREKVAGIFNSTPSLAAGY